MRLVIWDSIAPIMTSPLWCWWWYLCYRGKVALSDISTPSYIWITYWEYLGCSIAYEVRDLFPWEMLTKTAISCFLNVQKFWNSAQINLSSTLNFYRRYFFRHNNIHREIDQWNRRRFGAKWHVTVPNSVTPIKPLVCKSIYISQGWYCQMTHKLHVFLSFSTTRVKRIIWNQHISVNVYVAWILIKTIILKKRN